MEMRYLSCFCENALLCVTVNRFKRVLSSFYLWWLCLNCWCSAADPFVLFFPFFIFRSVYWYFSSFFLPSFSYYMGSELVSSDSLGGDTVLKHLWHHQDAILCCSLKVQIQFLEHGVSYLIQICYWCVPSLCFINKYVHITLLENEL